ncbi:MAG: stage II sporulation protein R [Oscillospiraceae bacterium]|nr:stage II sporulation protein R [Oscillospiraceae bacterium]
MNIFSKIIQRSSLKRFLILLFLFALFLSFSAISYVNAISNSISSSVFRLHIIANSNSDEDQRLKYLIRDDILEYIDEMTENLNYVDEVITFAENNIEEIRTIAQNTIHANGYTYTVNTQIGNFRFPTKQYGDITFPPGFYNALKIEIGESIGNNWWCVMFPPLCFVDVSSGIVPDSSREVIRENLLAEEYRLISGNSPDIRVTFRVLEMFQSINARI